MLEMGFVETVGAIARALPREHQTLLFSATFPDAVRALSTTYQRDALHVVVPEEDVTARITQVLYRVERSERGDRVAALIRILGHHRPESAIVFCNHRETCDEVAEGLARAGFAAVALHGGMEQHDRNTVLLLLRNGSLRVVVATDVAARGLDIDDHASPMCSSIAWAARLARVAADWRSASRRQRMDGLSTSCGRGRSLGSRCRASRRGRRSCRRRRRWRRSRSLGDGRIG
ncbi:MAG: hypothetical protein HOV81_39220 [Kofleriaceae bacterium]|nr:hypothetical protein [Kofleriaceae bacterium]